MDATTPSKLLAVQHQHIDQGVAGIVGGGNDTSALAAALRLLRAHLYIEEAALFPPLETTGLTRPVFVMKREHGQMWPLIARLDGACVSGASADDLRADCATLLQLLNMHNPKEEQIVYTAADRYEPAHPGESLVAAMAAAKMPDGWVCAMAPKG